MTFINSTIKVSRPSAAASAGGFAGGAASSGVASGAVPPNGKSGQRLLLPKVQQ